MKTQALRRNQQGMVSIMVTMIIMVIISLVVIGFAQVSRREQRQALDRQLSTQAFYAAETGINYAVQAIQEQNYNVEKSNCAPDASGPLSAANANNVLDAATGVEFTCLLVDPSPRTLEYGSIELDQSTVIPLEPVSGSLSRVSISWQDKSGQTAFNGCMGPGAGNTFTLPAVSAWPATCNAGVLRIDLIPRRNPVNRTTMMNSTLTAFLYPQNGANSPTSYTYSLNSPDRGAIIPVNCNAASTPRKCNINISMTNNGGVSNYYLRVRSIYRSSAMTISGALAGNLAVDLVNAQVMVDSTGKANDVLRRMSVRVPLSNIGNGVPEFPILTSDSICKRFSIAPNVSPTPASGDPACEIN